MTQPTPEVMRRYRKKLRKDKKRYARFLAGRRVWAARWRNENRNQYRARMNAYTFRLKIDALTHYGKGRKNRLQNAH